MNISLNNRERDRCDTIGTICSSEESHVCASDFVVGVADGSEQPLGNGSLSSVSREEVVEDGRVQGTHGSLSEVVVVRLDLRREVVV